MKCMSCGADLPDGINFCTSCGAKVVPLSPPPMPQPEPVSAPSYAPPPQPQQVYDPNQMYQNPTYTNITPEMQNNMPYPQQSPIITEESRPISAWGYIGYLILFNIPVIGIIMVFIFSFFAKSNVNLKNYARSHLIIFVFNAIIITLLVLWIVNVVIPAFQSIDYESFLESLQELVNESISEPLN